MIIRIAGLLPDGSTPRDGVVDDARRTINVPIGTSLDLVLSIVTPNGASVDLNGATIQFTLKKRPLEDIKIAKTGIIAGGGATFSILPADSKNLFPGYYLWDVWFTKAGKRDAVIPLSPWLFSASATPIP